MNSIWINNKEIKYVITDNNSRNTLLCIHGFNSSPEAFDTLHKKQNFNVISIDYSAGVYNVNELSNAIDKLIKRIKGRVYVFGHSLGGAVAAEVKDIWKVKMFIYLSPLTEAITRKMGYKLLSNRKVDHKIINKISKVITKIGNSSFEKFLNPPKMYEKFMIENISNKGYLENLTKEYKRRSKTSFAFFGDKDLILDHKEQTKFFENIDIGYKVIKGALHNPLKYNDEIEKTLNEIIDFRQRKSGSRIIK